MNDNYRKVDADLPLLPFLMLTVAISVNGCDMCEHLREIRDELGQITAVMTDISLSLQAMRELQENKEDAKSDKGEASQPLPVR